MAIKYGKRGPSRLNISQLGPTDEMYSLDYADCNIFLAPPLLAHSAAAHALSIWFFIVARSLFADLFEKILLPLEGRPCPGLLCGPSSFLTGVLLA